MKPYLNVRTKTVDLSGPCCTGDHPGCSSGVQVVLGDARDEVGLAYKNLPPFLRFLSMTLDRDAKKIKKLRLVQKFGNIAYFISY